MFSLGICVTVYEFLEIVLYLEKLDFILRIVFFFVHIFVSGHRFDNEMEQHRV